MSNKQPETLKFWPKGYSSFVTNAGIKDTSLDLGVIVSKNPGVASAMFTQNQILGEPIKVAKKHIQNNSIQAVIVNSKNSNVATGEKGFQDAISTCNLLAKNLGIEPELVFPSSTGVIGRLLPMQKLLPAIDRIKNELKEPPDFEKFASAIMTTDTFPKFFSKKVGNAVITGVAKGSGMIEPNMATMLSYFFTDAALSASSLDTIFRRIVNKTFNRLSIDSDTSTSDTAFILANGLAGPVDEQKFESALFEVATQLTRWLAFDGEGATKLFIVHVKGGQDEKQAVSIGRSIINSPLVKTAIYQGDPNWGRIYMAIGKTRNTLINPDKISIAWGNPPISDITLEKLSEYLSKNDEIHLTVDINLGEEEATLFGCDLTEEYVRINAYYTT